MLGGFFVILYIGAVLALTIFLIVLLVRFVNAHERIADALESVARNSKPDGR